jgi:hypothetical protein
MAHETSFLTFDRRDLSYVLNGGEEKAGNDLLFAIPHTSFALATPTQSELENVFFFQRLKIGREKKKLCHRRYEAVNHSFTPMTS